MPKVSGIYSKFVLAAKVVSMNELDKLSEMERRAEAYWIEGDKHSDIAYKQGWTDALKHAPEVLEMFETLEYLDCNHATSRPFCDVIRNALTAYQKAIEGGK